LQGFRPSWTDDSTGVGLTTVPASCSHAPHQRPRTALSGTDKSEPGDAPTSRALARGE
jgi:hypothetical protein